MRKETSRFVIGDFMDLNFWICKVYSLNNICDQDVPVNLKRSIILVHTMNLLVWSRHTCNFLVIRVSGFVLKRLLLVKKPLTFKLTCLRECDAEAQMLFLAKSIEAEGVGDMTEGDGAKLMVMKKEMMVKRQRNQTLRKEDEKIPFREINKRIKRRRVAQLLMEQKIHVAD
nr:PREDICTED: uncharacterized protein LOC108222945 isoform X2 [Daucus carota subsp. sativus]